VGGRPDSADILLLNSFATTGVGHRTHIAIIAGLLGLVPTDPQTPRAEQIAKREGMTVRFTTEHAPQEHPNALVLVLVRGVSSVVLKAVSIGGGNFEILDERLMIGQATGGFQ
jgi:L-serine dehydratase